jgi:CarD family transcriptional regulator
MAARKKSTNNSRSKKARAKAVASAERTKRSKRPAAKKSGKTLSRGAAASKARPTGSGKKAKTGKTGKTAASKAAAKGAAKKTKAVGRREAAGTVAVSKSNARVVGAKLQTKPPEDVKAPNPSKAQAPANNPGLKAQKAPAAVVPPANPVEPVARGFGEAPAKPLVPPVAKQKPVTRDEAAAPSKTAKPASHRQGFKLNEFVVYPAHGVGQIVAVEEQEVAGFKLELFVISFAKDKMTLRVPTSKVVGVGMRKISDPDTAKRSLDILSGRARIKRTMWSRRAQEYETKINSGDIASIAEVVRDLYRSEAQPEQSYSERQLYEAALDRMVREIAAVHKSNEIDALKAIEAQLQKTHARQKAGPPEASDREIEEAA